MTISSFSPIYEDSFSHPLEKCSFLRGSTQFFNFGQKSYLIRQYDCNYHKLEIIGYGYKPSWVGTILRIIAFMTVIIPLFMVLGILVYRSVNKFKINQDTSNRLSDLPDEILKVIFEKSGPSMLKIASTSQANKKILDNNALLINYQTTLRDLEAEYAEILRDFSPVSLVKIVEFLAPFDPKQAIKLANNIERHDKYLARAFEDCYAHVLTLIIKCLEHINPLEALKLAHVAIKKVNSIDYSDKKHFQKAVGLIEIAVALVRLNPHKSLKLADQAIAFAKKEKHAWWEMRALTIITEGLTVVNPLKVLEVGEDCVWIAKRYDIDDWLHISRVAKAFWHVNRQRALELATEIYAFVHRMDTSRLKLEILENISEILENR